MLALGQEAFNKHFKGRYLSLAQYSDCEPLWMKRLLCSDFARTLEEQFGLNLDWPTRPVAYLLERRSGDYLIDTGLDRESDFEYNYKERTMTESTQQRISITFMAEIDEENQIARPSMKLHFEPLEIKGFPSEKLLIITMKFSTPKYNLRAK